MRVIFEDTENNLYNNIAVGLARCPPSITRQKENDKGLIAKLNDFPGGADECLVTILQADQSRGMTELKYRIQYGCCYDHGWLPLGKPKIYSSGTLKKANN